MAEMTDQWRDIDRELTRLQEATLDLLAERLSDQHIQYLIGKLGLERVGRLLAEMY